MSGNWSVTQAVDEGPPHSRDPVTVFHLQAGELRELGKVLQPRARDLAAAMQVQAVELRELGHVLQPRVRDLAT